VAGVRAQTPALLLAHLSEQTLPAEELRTSAVSPTATPTPAGAGTNDPQPSLTPTSTSQPPVSDTVAGVPPGATPSGAPELPPIGEGASPLLMVSDSPLTSLIDNAPSPARAVSLRLADRAREDVLKGRSDDAIQSLTRALSVDPSDPYVYFYLGRAYLRKNDDHEALTFFQRAEIGLAADPLWMGETLAFEGACYEQLGKTSEAITAYRHALDSSPNNLMARTGYARLVSATEPPPLNGPPSEQAPGTAGGSALQPPPSASAPGSPPSPSSGN
jgi:Tetratricopeptide repeat